VEGGFIENSSLVLYFMELIRERRKGKSIGAAMAQIHPQQKRLGGIAAGVFGVSSALFWGAAEGLAFTSAALTPAGAAAAATMGIAAAVAAGLSGGMGIFAACPPRIDFDNVEAFERTDLRLSDPQSELESSLQGFLIEQLNLRKALGILVASLERQQGAEAVLRGEIGSQEDAERASEFEPLQREATIQSLVAYSELLRNSLELAPEVNDAWRHFRQEEVQPKVNQIWLRYRSSGLSGGTYLPPITDIREAREAVDRLRELYTDAKAQYRLAQFGVTDDVVGFSLSDKFAQHPSLWHLPETLLTQRWFEVTRALIDVELIVGDDRPEGTQALLRWPFASAAVTDMGITPKGGRGLGGGPPDIPPPPPPWT
jgi:hypothetical protein